MMEKQPQILLSTQAFLKAVTSGPSSRHMISGLVSIDNPCSEYSGNTTRSMVPRLRRALPLILRQRRRQHLEAVADGGAGVAAEARDRVEFCRVDPHVVDVDDVSVVMREHDLAQNDLAGFAEFQRDMAAAFERGRRF